MSDNKTFRRCFIFLFLTQSRVIFFSSILLKENFTDSFFSIATIDLPIKTISVWIFWGTKFWNLSCYCPSFSPFVNFLKINQILPTFLTRSELSDIERIVGSKSFDSENMQPNRKTIFLHNEVNMMRERGVDSTYLTAETRIIPYF
jgi:hypothetical protein